MMTTSALTCREILQMPHQGIHGLPLRRHRVSPSPQLKPSVLIEWNACRARGDTEVRSWVPQPTSDWRKFTELKFLTRIRQHRSNAPMASADDGLYGDVGGPCHSADGHTCSHYCADCRSAHVKDRSETDRQLRHGGSGSLLFYMRAHLNAQADSPPICQLRRCGTSVSSS